MQTFYRVDPLTRRSEGGRRAHQKGQREARRPTSPPTSRSEASTGVDRRNFLRRSGPAAGGLAALGTLPLGAVRNAEAGPPPPPGTMLATFRKNVCTHRSVGCTLIAKVTNGVWTGQEPGWPRPINRGSHGRQPLQQCEPRLIGLSHPGS